MTTSTPRTEAAKELAKWRSGIKRSTSMVWRSESFAWSEEIAARLDAWCATIDDPRDGCALVLDFFRGDDTLFRRCDDSSGDVGTLFNDHAKTLFVDFASRCPDKKWIADQIHELLRDDGYGVRDCLLEDIQKFLPEPTVRDLAERFEAEAGVLERDSDKRVWWLYIERLARALKDAPLFERTRIHSWGTLNSAAYVDIAQIWFDTGDAPTARMWLDKVPQGDNFRGSERDTLMVAVASAQGDFLARDAAAWRIFRRYRSSKTLATLLDVIGLHLRSDVVEQEIRAILDDPSLDTTSVKFLLDLGRIDQAEQYLLSRWSLLDGDAYETLLALAKIMIEHGRALVASLLYRAILDSLLLRARSKSYGSGANYLRTLARLASSVSTWQGFSTHEEYHEGLLRAHARKSAFWSHFKA